MLTATRLYSTRRKRPIPEGWTTPDEITTFDVKNTIPPVYPGSTVISLDESGDLALFGGTYGVAGVYSVSQQQLVHTLAAGSAVTATQWAGSRAVVATSSGAVKIFEDGNETAQLGSHAGPATSLALHPRDRKSVV